MNETILEVLEMGEFTEGITNYAKALSKARREGKEVSEMISGIEEEEVGELKGAEIVSEGKGNKSLTSSRLNQIIGPKVLDLLDFS